jgi:dTDP-4-amino-4,6-dideoxygalactose transaminase
LSTEFKKTFHVGRPNIPQKSKLLSKFSEVLDSEWLTNNGPMVTQLEHKIQRYLGVKHCVCVCNATIGLELLQRALDLKGEVIIPSFTFIATANSLRWQKIKPVFCDIKADTHLIDPDCIEELITEKTSAILAVPIWGQACNYNKLVKIAKKHKLKLIFDSAHAFGCKVGEKFIGGFGDAEVFSFHATKVFSTGEGGAITTNSDELAEKLRFMRNFGFDGFDRTIGLGTNAKMSEFAAAYGLASLEELESVINFNKNNYTTYIKEFENLDEIEFLKYSSKNSSNYQYIVAIISELYRDNLVEFFHNEKILVRKYFYPGCHKLEPYFSDTRYMNCVLPKTDNISSKVIVFPNGKQLTKSDISLFSQKTKLFLQSSK